MRTHRSVSLLMAAAMLLAGSALHHRGGPANAGSQAASNGLPDLSGLAWVEGDTFLAVHDAKNPRENHRPRVSLIAIPRTLEGMTWTALDIAWPPPAGMSSDLESVARVPQTNLFLLVESGGSGYNGRQFRRVFLTELKGQQLTLLSFTELPEAVINIEGSAVARLGERLVFLCAERGDSQPTTALMWADLQLRPLKLGSFERAQFRPLGFSGEYKRPVSALEVDRLGRIYLASAYDPNDGGPFASIIWRAGQVTVGPDNRVKVVGLNRPRQVARLDGFKVEALAIRESPEAVELFAGTDDENYGGALRLIPNRR